MRELAISVRRYNKDNYKHIIDSIKKANFKNVFIEWYDEDYKLQEDILNYVKESGLNIIFAHLGYHNVNALWRDSEDGDREEQKYINDIKQCSNNGINLVIIHPTYKYDDPGFTEIGLIRIKRILNVAKDYNVKVAFENVELVEYLEYIINNIDYSNLGICFDIGHCHLFCNDEFNIDLFKNKVYTIHLHDNFKEKDEHNLPFDGNVDWEKAIKQIINLNYDDYIVIESGYNNYYSDMSIEDYYKLAYDRGLEIIKLYELYSKK